jgi:hypothetical protein
VLIECLSRTHGEMAIPVSLVLLDLVSKSGRDIQWKFKTPDGEQVLAIEAALQGDGVLMRVGPYRWSYSAAAVANLVQGKHREDFLNILAQDTLKKCGGE